MSILDVVIMVAYILLPVMTVLGFLVRKRGERSLRVLANSAIGISVFIVCLLFAEQYVLSLPLMQADLTRGLLVLASYLFGCVFSLRAAFLVKEKRNKALLAVLSGVLGLVVLYLIILVAS